MVPNMEAKALHKHSAEARENIPSSSPFHYQTSNSFVRERRVCPDTKQSFTVRKTQAGILPVGFSPTDKDIICGRGKAHGNHKGNQAFISTVRANLQRYSDAIKRTDKSFVVASVVSEFLAHGIRFVKLDKATSRWHQMTEDQAHEKTGHAIRDHIKALEPNTDNGSKSVGGSSFKAKEAIKKTKVAAMVASLHSSAPAGMCAHDPPLSKTQCSMKRRSTWEPVRLSVAFSGFDTMPRLSRSSSDMLSSVLRAQDNHIYPMDVVGNTVQASNHWFSEDVSSSTTSFSTTFFGHPAYAGDDYGNNAMAFPLFGEPSTGGLLPMEDEVPSPLSFVSEKDDVIAHNLGFFQQVDYFLSLDDADGNETEEGNLNDLSGDVLAL